MSRSRKTPETDLAKRIRVAAAVYATNGQRERAEGMAQAADMVDELVKREGIVLPEPSSKRVRLGYADPTDPLEGRVARLELQVRRLELLVGHPPDLRTINGGPAEIAKKVVGATLDKWAEEDAKKESANGLLSFGASGSGTEPRSPMDAKMLVVLAQRAPKPTTDAQLSILTGYSRSGSFSGALARLRAAGWIEGDGKHISITAKGIPHVPAHAKIPTGAKLLEFWCDRVGTMGATVLQAIVSSYPNAIDVDFIVDATGYKKSGSLSGALAVLRTLNLITKRGIKASEELMQGIGS